MSALPLQAIPPIESFRPMISIMTPSDDSEQSPASKFLDSDGRLTCPACGCHEFRTPDSEPWINGNKRRYRQCRHCKLRVRTKEVVDDE